MNKSYINSGIVHTCLSCVHIDFSCLCTMNVCLNQDSVNLDSSCIVRQYCGPQRPFAMSITDNNGREVIHLERPLRCSAWCCFCCLQEIEVQAPPGQVVGYVKQE